MQRTWRRIRWLLPLAVVALLTACGGSGGSGTTVVPPGSPQITTVGPSTARAGENVVMTITGSGFSAGGATVTVGMPAAARQATPVGVTVVDVTVVSDTELRVTLLIAEDAVSGPRTLVVTTSAGSSTPFTFTVDGVSPAPTLTAIAPSSGEQGQAVTVTLTGTGFTGASVGISGDGVTVGDTNVASETELTATFTIAAGATVGEREVLVTTNSGISNAVSFTVTAPADTNQRPTANAGNDLAGTVGETIALAGTVSDDGQPNGTLTVSWTVVLGAGTQVAIANAAAASTTAVFSAAGTYKLRLEASDGVKSQSDDVEVTITAVVDDNQRPTANAGADQNATVGQQIDLAGSVADDGKPNGLLTASWTVVQGDGTKVAITNAAAASTQATFSAPGTYTLRLEASDGVKSHSDDVVITVTAVPANRAPVISNPMATPSSLATGLQTARISADVGDPDGDPVTVKLSTKNDLDDSTDEKMMNESPPGSGTYTRTEGFTNTSNDTKTWTVTITASDGTASTTATITVVQDGQNIGK